VAQSKVKHTATSAECEEQTPGKAAFKKVRKNIFDDQIIADSGRPSWVYLTQ